MMRTDSHATPDPVGTTEPDELALRALALLVAELDHRALADPGSAHRLSRDLLSLLLGPSGRALLPHASDIVARALAYRSSVTPEVGSP